MDYKSGTVFERIERAVADIGFYCMMANHQTADLMEIYFPSAEEARAYLRSLLFEAESDEKRAEWFKAVNNRISAINMMRAEGGRSGRVESMEKMLRELTSGDINTSAATWTRLQRLCGELGSVSRFIQNRIYEDMEDAVRPFRVLLN